MWILEGPGLCHTFVALDRDMGKPFNGHMANGAAELFSCFVGEL